MGTLLPAGLFDSGRGGLPLGWEAASGKLALLARMLRVLFTETTDRIVIVSNFTSSLDLFAQVRRQAVANPTVRILP